ncbi:MAG: hypothetical protein CM1200mP2_58820 [Planctomycetaceae bacterium]|nr:MAG: hypothetical protein CM1200mP2_58820 [Planctomycetaceae bacterium]
MTESGPSNPSRIRIGAVNYLNSKPLIEGLGEDLDSVAPGSEFFLDYPSRLADDLEPKNGSTSHWCRQLNASVTRATKS